MAEGAVSGLQAASQFSGSFAPAKITGNPPIPRLATWYVLRF
jgi:hypothetical protein